MTERHDIANCRKCFYLRIIAILFWSAALAVLSLQPGGHALYLFNGQDKILHFIAYLLTAWLACRSLQLFSVSMFKIVCISAIYCIVVGGLLEVLQATFSVNRQAEWLDWFANTVGAICGCAIFCLQQRLSSGHEKS